VGAALLLALVAWACAAAAAAQRSPLEAADVAYARGALGEAGRGYEDALATGSLGPAQLVRAHLRLGVLAALGAEDARAERHFRAALALDPLVEVPDELNLDWRARFEALRRARGGRPLRVVQSVEERRVVLSVRDAPPGLARTLEVRAGAWGRRFPWEGRPIPVTPPEAPVQAVVLDAYGNRLASAPAGGEAQAASRTVPEARPSAAAEGGPGTGGPEARPSAAAGGGPSRASGARGLEPRPRAVAEPASGEASPSEPVPPVIGGGPAAEMGPSQPAPREDDLSTILKSPWLWIAAGALLLGGGLAVGLTASGERAVLGAPVVR